MSIFDPHIRQIATVLKKNNWHIVTAESCTGGLLASYFTEIPGSSAWFERGFVTYSNEAKEEMLGVPKEFIVYYGAVSEQVAQSMAVGALQQSQGDIAVSITGIAGPDGGSSEKPVGTVWFAWAARAKEPKTIKKQFTGDRNAIRLSACQEALSGVLSYIHD